MWRDGVLGSPLGGFEKATSSQETTAAFRGLSPQYHLSRCCVRDADAAQVRLVPDLATTKVSATLCSISG